MAIEYINTGTIANDGTGDALREAFIKVNNNFEDLDLRAIEQTQIINVGEIGVGVYAGTNDNVAEFKRIVAGTNVTINENATRITIDVDDALNELLIISDNGSITVAQGQSMNIVGGNGITTATNGQTLNIELDSANIVSRDSSPTLSADLDASSNNIVNAGSITANTFNGSLEGLVYGYDVREFGPYLSGFDFGTVRNTYNNALEFILSNVDVDLGPIDPERTDLTIDLGFIS
jgi:hypothetical protein